MTTMRTYCTDTKCELLLLFENQLQSFLFCFFLVSKSQNEPAREELKALPLLPQYALLAL